MYNIAKNYNYIALYVIIAENNDANAHRCLLNCTVLSINVRILRNLNLYFDKNMFVYN